MKTASPHSGTIPLRLVALYGGLVLAMFLFFALAAWMLRTHQQASEVRIPDEKSVAEELLLQKLSGPRYFQPESPPAAGLPRPFITPAQARSQVERVMRERQFAADMKPRLEALILQLTEPSSSRLVGSDRINANRLNLALDELR